MTFLRKIRAFARFPLSSLARVGAYRLGVKTGTHPVFWIRPAVSAAGEFFSNGRHGPVGVQATPVWRSAPWAFGREVGPPSTTPPDWHANILTGERVSEADQRWDRIPSFSNTFGDIKAVWEASRFDWVLSFAQAARAGDSEALPRLNAWLQDWVEQNPPYRGPNWMCGQEASIRVARLVLGARILGGMQSVAPALESLILTHLRRIKPTTGYARGQDNNHGTSEAMGLFMGGLWLARTSADPRIRRECARYAAAGRKLAEDRVRKLIFADGGFAQYSMVYHRLMLDSLSLMELWRRDWAANPFSDRFMRSARAATEWLEHFVDCASGDVPNLGSNDGAWLLPLGPASVRDFRPSVALASTLYGHGSALAAAPSARGILDWLGLSSATGSQPVSLSSGSRLFPESGLAALTSGPIRVFLRFPTYRYRPHQADALHLDLWVQSHNLLCDAGTFSYACEGWSYYPSTAAHNTVEFDGRDQMPRLGRFLYGEWSRTEGLSLSSDCVSASYTDHRGAKHERTVLVKETEIVVTDKMSGAFEYAILRWHLPAQVQKCNSFTVMSDQLRLEMEIEGGDGEMDIGEGSRSLHYLASEKTASVRLRVAQPCTVTTRIHLIGP